MKAYKLLRQLSSIPLDDNTCLKFASTIEELSSYYGQINDYLKIDHSNEWNSFIEEEIDNFLVINPSFRKKLGQGTFASAFLGVDGFVYKMNAKNRAYDPWLEYAITAKQFPNKLMPKIYEIKISGNTYCAKVEKLKPLSKPLFQERYIHLEELIKSKDINSIVEILKSDELNEHEIKQWCEFFFKLAEDTGSQIDIREDNLLVRGNQLVINDPLAFGYSSQLLYINK